LIDGKNWDKINWKGDFKMLNLEVRTKLPVEKVIHQLKKFFGKEGLGLDVTEETSQCLTFEGGGGHVTATVCPEESKTQINLETQEWEIQVKKFASGLP
jgi:hypothetical protein